MKLTRVITTVGVEALTMALGVSHKYYILEK